MNSKLQKVPKGYQQTEVGIIPKDWDVRRLGDICDFSTGIGLLKGEILPIGQIPAIPYTALYTDFSEILDYEAIKWFVVDARLTRIVNEPCVLIASSSNMEANTGKASALTRSTPVAIGREIIILKPKCDSAFISYLLSTLPYRKKTLMLARGTTIKHVYTATFYEYAIAFPSRHEQEIITAALTDVDTLITSLEKLIAKKRAIKTAAMQQLLTGKKRLAPFDTLNNKGGATRYKQTELGKIPEDWEVVTLGGLAKFYKGKGLPKADLVDGGKRECIHYGELFTRYSEVIGNVVISRTSTNSESFLSEENDVLMPTSDVTPNGLATASSIKKTGVILGGDILVIRPDKKSLDSTFFAYLISISKDKIMQLVSGSTVYHLYGSDMATFKFAKPYLIDEQVAIAKLLMHLSEEVIALEQRLNKTQQIKQGMMQELLTGRTRLI